MTVHEEIKLFEKTVLELGFEKVKQNTFRWYINPIIFVDIEITAHFLLYTCKIKLGKPNEPLGSLEYNQRIYKSDDLLWCDNYYIKKIIQSLFADMIAKYIDLSWGTVIMK